MTDPYDIFETDTEGNALWRAAAPTMESAQEMVQKFGASAPGNYFIWNVLTGKKLFIACPPDGKAASNGA